MSAAPPVSLGRAELVFALGAGLVLVSGLLPWIVASEAIPVADPSEEADGLGSFGEDSTSEEILGIDRVDWVVLAGVSLVATGLAATEPWSRIVLGVAGASGAAAVGLGAAYLADPAWMYSDWIHAEIAAVASAGLGAYLAIGGGVLQLGGCYLGTSSAASTAGARQLGAPASPPQSQRREERARQQTPRRGPPTGRRSPQRTGPNQNQRTEPGGRPQQRGSDQRPATENTTPPNDQRPPEGRSVRETGQPRRGISEREQSPRDTEQRRPASGHQQDSGQQDDSPRDAGGSDSSGESDRQQ
jgi:hypothetical protein